MAYADSALDYSYQIEEVRVADQYMRVKYFTTDSYDGRPDIVRNFEVLADQWDSTSLRSLITEDGIGIVTIWDKYLESSSVDSTAVNSLVGVDFSTRYKVRLLDDEMPDFTDYNWIKNKLVGADSEGNDDIQLKWTTAPLDSDEEAVVLSSVTMNKFNLLTKLVELGKFDSVQSILGFDSGSIDLNERISFEYNTALAMTDSASDRIRVVLGYNDSDFYDWVRVNNLGEPNIRFATYS